MPKITHFSPSSLACYKNCPREFFYKYIAKINLPGKSIHLLFGSAVHAGLEHIDNDPIAHFMTEYDKSKLSADEHEDYDRLLPIGHLILKKYAEQKDFLHKLNNVSLEGQAEIWASGTLVNPLTKEKLPMPMKGKIDNLSSNGIIKEYKTSSKKYDMNDENFKFQTKLYDLWHYSQFGVQSNGIVYFVFVKNEKVLESGTPIQVLNIHYSLEELAEAFEQIKGLLEQIEQGFFNRGKCLPYCDCRKIEKALSPTKDIKK